MHVEEASKSNEAVGRRMSKGRLKARRSTMLSASASVRLIGLGIYFGGKRLETRYLRAGADAYL